MPGNTGISAISATIPFGGAGGLVPWDIDPLTGVFTPAMRQTAGALFDRSPIAQGRWAATGVPDRVYVPRGTSLGNVVSGAVGNSFYSNFDYNQGAIAFLIAPEWDGNDGKLHRFLAPYDTDFSMYKFTDSILYAVVGTRTITGPNVAAWTAGTTYLVILRWNCHNTLDGTNYGCISVNDVHTFGAATQPNVYSSGATWELFTDRNGVNSADAIVEAFCISRIPWYDGAYGVNTGQGDVLAEIYNGGSFRDPAEVVGSWDMTLMVPTNQADSALQATGSAWSHPHGSNILDSYNPSLSVGGPENMCACDGGYLGGPFGWYPGGTNNSAHSAAAVFDDIGNGTDFTWEGWIRNDSDGAADSGHFVEKGGGTSGWRSNFQDNGRDVVFAVFLDNTNASANWNNGAVNIEDGKWHHICGTWDWATRTAKLYVDGIERASGVGVGNWVSDAAVDLHFGNRNSNNRNIQGLLGWQRISDTIRYSADFIAPRALPGADGNTIDQWPFDEGTGLTAAAVVASPANDLTLDSATYWANTWDQEGTPVIPTVLEFYQQNDGIDFGSGANIDDLPTGDCTIEFCARIPADFSATGRVISKGSSTAGWDVTAPTNSIVRMNFQHATNDAIVDCNAVRDDSWHHYAFDWDFGTLTLRSFLDGVLDETDTAVGAYQADATLDCIVNGRTAIGTLDGAFAISAIRLSDNRRYTGASFVPPDMANWPANDANAQLITTMRDGAGATVTDYSGNGYNGTITFGADTRWWNWADVETTARGHGVFNWGLWLGSDSADDGMRVLTQTGLVAGSNYVGRVLVKYGYSRRAQPAIEIYDETNGAIITTFTGPPLVGTHTGANNSATMTAAGAVFPYSLVGSTIYNTTDDSSGTITAVGGTNQDTVTAALAGGTDNDWDTNDQYMIVPPNESTWCWAEHFCWELPTIARNGVVADCTAYSVALINAAGEGALFWQQAEVQTNRFDNPSLDTGAGAPWIPDGWTNNGMDPGDTVQEVVTVHSGVSSLEFVNVDASGEYIQQELSNTPAGTFLATGAWLLETTNGIAWDPSSIDVSLQRALNVSAIRNADAAYWKRYLCAIREKVGRTTPLFLLDSTVNGADGFFDDVYAFNLDNITLTVTPSSAANSAESSGIRVDGRDTLTVNVPPGELTATEGWPRVGIRPRHAAAILDEFGANNPTWLLLWGDATNYAMAYVSANNQVTLEFNDGGGVHTVNWNCAGAIATDTAYTLGIRWVAAQMELLIDELVVATIVQPVNFATIPTVAYCGCHQDGARQADAVFLAPGLV